LKYILLTSLSVLLFLTIGLIHFMRAAAIAQYYRNIYSSNRFLKSAIMSPFRLWVDSPFYETWIRIFGVLMILVAAFLAFVMIHGLLS